MIVAGFGFRGGATVASLADALDRAWPCGAVTLLSTVEDKAQRPTFLSFAETRALPIQPITKDDLAAQVTLTQSSAAKAARGVGSVAEAAALAAAGPSARLLGPRVVSGDGMATCALAEGQDR
ncbi:MAG: cobalamin biosynthesis protein [Pseudomonadota bacterium]